MVSAYVLVSVEPGQNQEVVSALRGVGGVRQCHACWGHAGIFTLVEVADEKAWVHKLDLPAMRQIPQQAEITPVRGGSRRKLRG